MNSQGSDSFDSKYIESLTDRIKKIDSCGELKRLAEEVLPSFQSQVSAVESQIAALKPIVELLENPAAELPKILSWIEKFIEAVLKPAYQPVITMEKQLVEAAEAYARLIAAFAEAAARIGECVVEAPALIVSEVVP
ncbi:hypothetical protein Gbfr_022_002 [Gluconobacter frateurii M-2]|nr:hypothetical protein Gbfr_022_002 [Gluconobacter frateurii M-2]